MEQKERNTGIWKRFFLDHLFLLLCTVLLWTGIEAIVCYVKNKEPKEKEIC